MRDCKDEIKPIITQVCEALFLKATEPIKRNVRELEANMVIIEKKLNNRID